MIRQTNAPIVPAATPSQDEIYQLLLRMNQMLADMRVRLERMERNAASDRDYTCTLAKQVAPSNDKPTAD